METDEAWFEVWADRGLQPPYLLMLLGGARPNVFEIFDPKEQSIVHVASSYQEARFWLSEDEYEPVGDRTAMEGD